jgi:dolichyl-phosphate beta-glucosyltransferase
MDPGYLSLKNNMNKPYLSIIIPAYNEKENFEKNVLQQMKDLLNNFKFSWEVLIIDDGSTDGSVELLQKFCQKNIGFRLIKNKHMGKAGTVATGVKEASGQYILFTDFDQATPISEFSKLLPYLKSSHDIVIGSREVAGSKREKEPFYRHLMGRGFNFGVKLIAVRGFHDTQCGFKAFEANVAKDLFSKLQVYKPKEIISAFTGAFDVEILFIAKKMKLKIAEVPVHWKHVVTDRISPLKDSILMAIDVIKIRLYHLAGRYR